MKYIKLMLEKFMQILGSRLLLPKNYVAYISQICDKSHK